jgi:hypothetical protein
MNRKFSLATLFIAATAAACSSSTDDPAPVVEDGTIAVTADVTANTTWSAGNTYTLRKHVFVKDGATLTIEPGTVVQGYRGSSLVVTTTGKINAVGTAAAPVVFTSAQPAGYRAPGDWGGVVLLGLAPINVAGGTNQIEGFPAGTAGTTYGGADATHDCGAIKYARIEFAGFQLAVDNELNGLTVGACGSQTELDFVQVHKGADDGIEFFGGTTDLKHALVTQPDDDGLDWDYGWTGRAQFIVVQQNALVGDRGIEADNNGSAHDALPRSNPTIYNLSLIGSNAAPGTAGKNQGGIHFRRGTAANVYNAIVMGFADKVIDVDAASTVAQFTAGELFLKNSLIHDNANIVDTTTTWPETTDNDGGFDEAAEFFAVALANEAVNPNLGNPYDLAAPSFLPVVGSPALTGGATPPADGFFDVAAAFKGAFGTVDWTSGWTAFPAN